MVDREMCDRGVIIFLADRDIIAGRPCGNKAKVPF